ncbi:hypothetical protein N7448_001922 [Penicillium atrosanguineum]|uniref:Small EDRK-rich factor-like N-terminal domain-containing protein n=1 Tax=Penicillium atrosanguineum TaxID=1132637 RepID=A0A9W9U2G7_9EURO|nr:uncharacterized protein N7443_005323 [Penicillium atrosanguineum]KAJ5144530.1 hypothetical protein N7448_001922 [Penicillium atrosanguineum]KAJ5300321.1 hypothetical protein N7443_005323 [Penicillium atrosanguineum]KAJ5310961.1 hypothetical protein N7476_006821 [Penicillium atrosanguineum]
MGNGAKASMKRERNQKDAKAAKSQTKSTTKAPAYVSSFNPRSHLLSAPNLLTYLRICFSLLEHASNKHKKGLADCFPGVSV